MAPVKPFLQVFPGQNDPNLKPRKGKEISAAEWERKQRLKEYRIAARREKRNRKSDEKKQRKLNATILRRMTRNPTKYTKNTDRNRLRAIEQERRKIQGAAIQAAQRLAAVYDPTGAMFNVKPVTYLEDGRVVTLEAVERRKQKDAEKARQQQIKDAGLDPDNETYLKKEAEIATPVGTVNPERLKLLFEKKMPQPRKPGLSKTQLKKEDMYESRAPLAKPILPEGIDLPSDEGENWLALWDLADDELERRVLRAKKRAAKGRKELRIKQRSGKAERRAARDEKRRVYREIKQSWKVIREEERRRRRQLLVMEDEERKRLGTELTAMHRKRAMEVCAELGFTLENVEGVDEIQPRALGMKGQEVPFDKLEMVGERPSGLRLNGEPKREKSGGNRVDLGAVPDESLTRNIPSSLGAGQDASMNANFVELGSGDFGGQEHATLNYNHKLRRKLRRAIESAQVKKELLVRAKAIEHCEANGIEVDPVLRTPGRPQNIPGQRVMPDGTLETAKQERVRARVELAEFNRWAKILRRQAKDMSVEAGIRIYLELMERIPKRAGWDEMVDAREREKKVTATENSEDALGVSALRAVGGIWPAQSTAGMTRFLDEWMVIDGEGGNLEGAEDVNGDGMGGARFNNVLDEEGQEMSEDSAGRQIQMEMEMALSESAKDVGSESESESESEGD